MKSIRQTMLSLTAVGLLFVSAHAHANSFGFRFSPFLAASSAVDLSIDIGLGSNWVFSPEGMFFNLGVGTLDWKYQAYGASLSYHFRRAFSDGFYLGPTFRMIQFNAKHRSDNDSGELSTTFVGGRAGYLWQWQNFYMNLGGIFGSYSDTKIEIKDSSGTVTDEETFPSLAISGGIDFKIGWSF